MKKKGTKIILGTLVCALGVGAFAVGSHGENQHMKAQLVNKENHFVVLEIEDDRVTFNDPILEVQMRELGVFIPPTEREKFEGKNQVTLDDPDFIRAFKEHYIPSNLHSETYSWEEVETN